MYIFNVRKGFATNSSSSHSVIELKEDSGKFGVITDEYTNFGWEFFTAANLESKQNYIAASIKENLSILGFKGKKLDKELERIVGKDIFKSSKNAYIDHQSVITFPRNFDNKTLNEEFIKDVFSYISKDSVVITGGNDNSCDVHPLLEDSVERNSPKMEYLDKERNNSHYVARKDKDYWTIFNRSNGEKVRFSFESEDAPLKAFAPELADIKITDYCPYDCGFCYQNSTISGKHASIEDIKKIANELEKEKVYEVALGGGETTLHPQFVEILKLFKSKNIVPNFTTKNLNLLRQSNALEVINNCGAMAFSVQSLEDMQKVKSAYVDFLHRDRVFTVPYSYSSDADTSPWKPKITFQIVMGVMDESEFKKMIEFSCNFGARVTLLGYKENGRGSSFSPHDYSFWLDYIYSIKKDNNLPISIDTLLATEFEKELLSKEIDKTTFHTNEGAFSIYIDAVKMKFYPSSYVGLENSKDFDKNWLKGYEDMNVKPIVRKGLKIKSLNA